MASVPGEYCGWARDGSVAYSKNFLKLLGLGKIEDIHDIQNALSPGDAAVLEGSFIRLQKGKPFHFIARSKSGQRSLLIRGTQGRAQGNEDRYNILWVQDVSEEQNERFEIQEACDTAEEEAGRLKSALNNLQHPMWMRDADGKLFWCNIAYAEALQKPPAEILKEQKEFSTKKIQGEDLNPGPDLGKRALREGKIQNITAIATISGARSKMQFTEIPIPSSHTTFGIALDLSREQILEDEIKRYTTANKELLGQLQSAISIFNNDQALEFYNSAFAQLWGLEEQWLNAKPKLGDIMEKLRETRRLPEQADFRSFKKSWLNMFTSLIEPFEDMLYLPDGLALRMLSIPHPMGGLMMTFEDVTSRLELESSYNTLIAVQKETLDNLEEAVVVYGTDGRLKLWNPSFAKLWDLNPEDLEGEPHITGIVEKKRGFFAAEFWEDQKTSLIAHGLERSVAQDRLERADGTLLDFTTVPLPDGGVMINYFDVTASVRVENALREKNAALEAAEKLKLDFLANVSYQLRTPLNVISGFAEILNNQYFGNLNERQREYTEGIKEAGERLMNMIDDILDLSTIEAGYMELKPEKFSVYDMLKNLHELTTEWARKQDLEVTLECPKNIGSLEADERRIKQILLSLIQNAINNSLKDSKITLRGARKKEEIVFTVEDTGRGIAKEDLERIFEPFERGEQIETNDQTQDNAQDRGAGLGLTLVKNIAELHGGRVEIESAPGQGTKVHVSIPLEARHVILAEKPETA